MSEARSEDERLPWLDAPRGTKPGVTAKKVPPKAARRAQAPIFVLLSLFLIAGLGMMSYFVGRVSVPVAQVDQPAPRPAPPAPRAPVALPPAAPSAPSTVEMARRIAEASPAPARASKPVEPEASPTRRVKRTKVRARPVQQASSAPVRRAARVRRPAPVRRVSPQPPVQLIHASQVIQVGTYRSRRQADAAHRRLVRVYPYVRTLPKVVRPTRPNGSVRTFYRLQYQEYSPEYARLLCRNLRAIGRGCAVLPAGR